MCVRRFMEFLVNVAPSAAAMPGMLTKDGRLVPYEVNGPASAFVFSTTIEQHREISTILKLFPVR